MCSFKTNPRYSWKIYQVNLIPTYLYITLQPNKNIYYEKSRLGDAKIRKT